MEWNMLFLFNSILLGIGLAMDAFAVSLANGLREPDMKKKKTWKIAGVFSFFQALMPMTGWVCVHTVLQYFQAFEKCIPWIALILLLFIGGKMLVEGLKGRESEQELLKGDAGTLLIQGVATSIDALSVGFTIAEYGLLMAVVCTLIIAAVTFAICLTGLSIGRRFGTKFAGRATVFGGVILLVIGFEIFSVGVF